MWLGSMSFEADTSKQGKLAESDHVVCVRKNMSYLSNQFLFYFKSLTF